DEKIQSEAQEHKRYYRRTHSQGRHHGYHGACGAVVAMKAPEVTTRDRWRPAEVALVVLAALAVIAVAKWAQAFLIPLTAGMLIAYALKPVVGALERLHVHRVIGAVVVLAALTATIVGGIVLIRDDAIA